MKKIILILMVLIIVNIASATELIEPSTTPMEIQDILKVKVDPYEVANLGFGVSKVDAEHNLGQYHNGAWHEQAEVNKPGALWIEVAWERSKTDIILTDQDGRERKIYLPSSNNRGNTSYGEYYWIAMDGSSYFAHSDRGHGWPDLSVEEAMSLKYLARKAPIDTNICHDTDGGKDYYEKGRITTSNGISKEDYCTSEPWGDHTANLIEYYCLEDGTRASYGYECSNGCYKGACIKEEKLDLSNYPKFLIKDNELDALIVVWEKAPSSDVAAAIDIAAGISKNTNVYIKSAVLDKDIDNLFAQNLILVGSDNPLLEDFINNYAGDPEIELKGDDHGYIGLYNVKGKYQIVIAGESTLGTRKAARVLKNYPDYYLTGTQLDVGGTLEKPIVTNLDEQTKDQIRIEKEQILYFYSPTCGYCAKMSPVIDLMISNGIDIQKVNINENRDLAEKYGIKGVPSVVVITNEKHHTLTGYNNYQDLLKWLKQFDYDQVLPVPEPEPAIPEPVIEPIPEPIDKDPVVEPTPKPVISTGCWYEGTKIPVGTRTNKFYCDIDGLLKPQKQGKEKANNNYECRSNLSVDGHCIEQGFFNKIMNWFSKWI